MSPRTLQAAIQEGGMSRLERVKLAVELSRAVARIHRRGAACLALEAGSVLVSEDGTIGLEARPGDAEIRGRDLRSLGRLLADLLPGVLPGAVPLVQRCLEESDSKVQDAGTVALLLEDSLVRERERVARRSWRRLAVPGVGGAAGLAAGLVAAMLAGGGGDASARGPSQVRSSILLHDGSFPRGHPGAMPLLSPDGRLLAVLDGEAGIVRHRIFELDTGRDWWLEGLPPDATLAAFSPGGREILYFSWDEPARAMGLWIRSLAGGEPRLVAHTAEHRGASWGPDGDIVFNAMNRGGLAAVAASGNGDVRVLTTPDRQSGEMAHRWPRHLPGGEGVLFVSARKAASGLTEAELCVVSTTTGAVKTLVRGGTMPAFLPPDRLLYAWEGKLMAAPFDPDRLEVTGSPAVALDDLLTLPWNGYAGYSLADGGTLAWVGHRDVTGAPAVRQVRSDGVSEPLSLPPGSYSFFDPSPDGRRLLLAVADRGTDVWLYEMERETATRLTLDGGSHPRWTPDGRRMAYFRWQGEDAQIWLAPVDGSAPPDLLLDEPGAQVPMDFSPDGGFLLYATEKAADGRNLRVLSMEDRVSRPLVATGGGDESARFSPGGRWVAYVAPDGGGLRLVAFPGGDIMLTAARGSVSRPQWTDRGDLYFILEGQMQVVADAESLADAGAAMVPRAVPGGLDLGPLTTVAPDGSSFLIVTSTPPGSDPWVRLALGWRPAF